MVEIAICLAIIAFALVAIIGVLPIGMNAQKENREETLINFDAHYLMDAIRSGSQGADTLTNYIICITNIKVRAPRTSSPIHLAVLSSCRAGLCLSLIGHNTSTQQIQRSVTGRKTSSRTPRQS